jgi:protein-tyrosine phosphatase
MITRVWKRLCIGSVKDAERLASDNPMGIATVVSLCPEEISCKARGTAYVNIPIADAQPILLKQFEEIMATIAEHIRFGAVLLMCAAWMSRSPIMAAAWMHRCGYLNFEAALEEIAKVRPIIDPSPVLLNGVKEELSR